MIQAIDSDAQVLTTDSQLTPVVVTKTTSIPAATTNPAAMARRQPSKATVANDATTTAHVAAWVNS